MRFSLVLALTLAALTMTASAQKHQKPAKPSYTEQKQAKSPHRTVQPPAAHSSASQELHRVEQSSAKASASRKADGRKAHMAPVRKADKKEANPPIRVSAAGSGSHGSKSSKSSDPYKGRLRSKGSHR